GGAGIQQFRLARRDDAREGAFAITASRSNLIAKVDQYRPSRGARDAAKVTRHIGNRQVGANNFGLRCLFKSQQNASVESGSEPGRREGAPPHSFHTYLPLHGYNHLQTTVIIWACLRRLRLCGYSPLSAADTSQEYDEYRTG